MTYSTTARAVVLAGLLFVCLFASTAQAQDDIVEVASGQRINGDVRNLRHGMLAFRTPAAPGAQRWAGTISIVWSEVVSVTSVQTLEVELASDELFVGTISSPLPGQVVVQTAAGPSRPLAMNSIVRITRVEPGFRARVEGSLGFGLILTHDTATYSLNGDATHRSRNHTYETGVSFSSWLLSREDTDALSRNDVKVDVRRRLGNGWFAIAMAGAQQDEELQLDARYLVGGGIGRTLLRTNRTELSVQGGLDYDAEKYADEDAFDHSAELFAGTDWNWFAPGHVMDANVAATFYASLARSRVRLELDASLRRDIFWDMFWSLNAVESFDGDPPQDRPRSNFTVTLALGWTF